MLIWQPEPVTTELDRITHYSGLWGVDGIELRTVGRRAERVPYVNEAPVRHKIDNDALDVAISDPGMFSMHMDDRAGWMNDVLLFPEVVAFNRRLGIRATIIGAMSGGGDLPLEPYEKVARVSRDAGQTLLLEDNAIPERTRQVISQLKEYPVKRVVATEYADPTGNGPGSEIGLIRCLATITGPVDQDGIERAWTPFLKELVGSGFDGAVVMEFSSDDVGKTGLRLATGLIKAIRAANLKK